MVVEKCENILLFKAGQLSSVEFGPNHLIADVYYDVRGSVQCLHCGYGKQFLGKLNVVTLMKFLKFLFYSNLLAIFELGFSNSVATLK